MQGSCKISLSYEKYCITSIIFIYFKVFSSYRQSSLSMLALLKCYKITYNPCMLEAETGNLQSKAIAYLVDERNSGFSERLCLNTEDREKLKKSFKIDYTHTHTCTCKYMCVHTIANTCTHMHEYQTNIHYKNIHKV